MADINSPTYVSDMAMERQAADEKEKQFQGSIDIPTLAEGKWRHKNFESSLLEIAKEIGFMDKPNPAPSAGHVVKSATNKFIRNFFITVMVEACQKNGMSESEADEFVSSILYIHDSLGSDMKQALEEVIY